MLQLYWLINCKIKSMLSVTLRSEQPLSSQQFIKILPHSLYWLNNLIHKKSHNKTDQSINHKINHSHLLSQSNNIA